MNIPRELVEQFARGNGVVFAGAGLSQGAGLPGWGELVSELAAELGDCPSNADYRDIAQYYETEYGRNRLVQRLRDKLEALNAAPTQVHDALVELPLSIIFTTNYDNLLEHTFRKANLPFTTIIGNIDVSFWSADRLHLIKLHGDINQPDFIVITSGDYERFAERHISLARLLTTILQMRTVLFCGYSVTDPDLRLILTQVQSENNRYARNLFSVQFGAPTLMVKDLERRGVRVINLGTEGGSYNDVLRVWLQHLNMQIVAEMGNRRGALPSPLQKTPRVHLAEEAIGLLRTMGYSISLFQDRQHSVDFFAEKISEGANIRRWFRCTEGSVGTGQVQLMAHELQHYEGAELYFLTYRSGMITPQARAECNLHGKVKVLSLAEFYRAMIRFDSYLERMLVDYETTQIPKYWVNLACEVPQYDSLRSARIGNDMFESIEDFLDIWIDTPGRNHISILGDFGTGKTWLCHHYAAKLAKKYLSDCEHNRAPIIISLKNCPKSISLKQLITDTLVNECAIDLPGGYRTFEYLNRNDDLVLILDGFDEMQVKLDDRASVENFEELAKVVLPDANSKVILTCRTAYFRSDLEEREFLSGEGLQRIKLRDRPNFEILHLLPFDTRRIQESLQRRVPDSWEEYYNRIQGTYDLPDLSRRPILLGMIAHTLPTLLQQHHVSSTSLYQIYTDEWVKKNISEQRTFIDEKSKLYFMQELAWEMLVRQILSIHYSDFPKRVRDYFGLKPGIEVDHFEHDIRTQSFLQRGALGHYTFAHKSFMEFFVAQKIFGDIERGDSRRFSEVQTTHETDQFIKDFIKENMQHSKTLVHWMRSGANAVLRVNSAGVLAKISDPETTGEVIRALKQDKEVRHLYLTAVLFRILEIKWEAADRLATEENGSGLPNLLLLPGDQLGKVVDKCCIELLNPRDGVARWLSVVLLYQLSDIAPLKIQTALREALQTETTLEIVETIRLTLTSKICKNTEDQC